MPSRRSVLPATLIVPIALALCAPDRVSAQQQNSDQQRCLNTLNKDTAKLAKTRAKLNNRCIKDLSRARIADVDACRNDDSVAKIAGLIAKIQLHDAAKCAASPPDFGYGGPAAIEAAALADTTLFDNDIFGSEMNGSVIDYITDRIGSRCQDRLHRKGTDLIYYAMDAFNDCKKLGLSGGTVTSSIELQACFDAVLTDIATTGTTLATKAAKLETERLRCENDGVDLSVAMPACCDTTSSDCAVNHALRRACRILNGTDTLAIDCDAITSAYDVEDSLVALGGMSQYDLEHPPPPTVAPGAVAGWLHYRWVPLCADGSGDHLWSLNPSLGTAPTCIRGSYIRCVDGSRPMYRIDHAVDAAQTDVASNDWAFFFQGGGSCYDGDSCFDEYGIQPDEMSSINANHATPGAGILGVSVKNPLHDAHRVRILKCSFDRYVGDRTKLCSSNTGGDRFNLYWHGRRIVDAVLTDLSTGVGLHDESCNPGDDTDLCKTLPPLTEAAQVVIAGHSGGASGLVQNLDYMAAAIENMAAGPAPDVRGIFDAQFKPSLDNEPTFENGVDTNASGHIEDNETVGSSYDQDPNSPSAGLLPLDYVAGVAQHTRAYSAAAYDPGGGARDIVDAWGTHIDESCTDAHDIALCYAPGHLMFNHIDTPYFLRQALRDSVHVDAVIEWSDDVALSGSSLKWGQNTPAFGVLDFSWRVLSQLTDLTTNFGSFDEMSTGVDASGAPGWSPPGFFTNTTVHDGADDGTQFTDVCLRELPTPNIYSYADLVGEWLASPPGTSPRVLIEGRNAVNVTCP